MTLQEDIQNFKKYVNARESINGKYFNRNVIERKFPKLHEQMKLDNPSSRIGWLFNVYHDITEIAVCQQCKKPVKFNNFREGFMKFCSPKCVNEHNSSSEEFSRKISESRSKKYNEKYLNDKYTYVKKIVTESDGRCYFLIDNYCEHGEFMINTNTFKSRMKFNFELCDKCATDRMKSEFDGEIDHKKIKFMSFGNLKMHFPELLGSIVRWSSHLKDVSFSEQKLLYVKQQKDRPICPICKSKDCYFPDSIKKYSKTCNQGSCVKSSSQGERDIVEFVKNLGFNPISRYQESKHEIDIFIPDLNVGIEHNGLYWHSDKHKPIDYHSSKIDFFRNKGVQLINIWEDDWNFKRPICESIIRNKLGKSTAIHARKCEVREVSSMESAGFLEKNHIQGKCNDSTRFGLYLNDELVSLMTFGKKRMILNSGSDEGWELLRFCNIFNRRVMGGASKLFSHFIEAKAPVSIISYANCDISQGNLYEKLGFRMGSRTTSGYWWCKDGKKYHRSNFMKHKIAKTKEEKSMTEREIMKSRGFFRVWNAGNLKYVWSSSDI